MSAEHRPHLTIVIPVFQEAEVLPRLLERLASVRGALDVASDVVFVDDGSLDDTPAILRRAHADDRSVGVVFLSRNFGHQMALSAGLEAARGDAVAVLDADLQDPPELLADFLAKWREGYHVVYGVRRTRREGWLRRLSYTGFYRLLRRVSAIDIPVDAGDFCLLDRRVAGLLADLPERTRFLRGLRSWVGFRQVGVPYDRPPRAAGRAKYSWRDLFALGFEGIFSFSHLPLRLASYLGFATAALAIGGVGFYLAWWGLDFTLGGRRPQDVAGFLTTTLLVLFFAGVQLLSLGLLGEYVGRIYVEVKRRPAWIVAERLGVPAPDGASAGDGR